MFTLYQKVLLERPSCHTSCIFRDLRNQLNYSVAYKAVEIKMLIQL